MSIDVSNLTEAEIITLLQMLFTNMNNLDRIYYDLFINTNPMDLTLERYDENGVLQTYVIPNRAKDRGTVLSGSGSPEGATAANIGSFYIDTLTSNLYYKSTGSDTFGWVMLHTALNFRSGYEYLAPNGNGSNLQNLNGGSITGGVIGIGVGGTNNTSFTAGSMLKYDRLNSSSPYKIMDATADVDYVSETSMVGQVAFFLKDSAPTGWLEANGSTPNQVTYARLYGVIGTRFNTGTEPEGTFRLPDLRGYFLRAWDHGRGVDSGRGIMTVQQCGVPNITGTISFASSGYMDGSTGAISRVGSSGGTTSMTANNQPDDFSFDASRSSNVYQSISEVRPINFSLIACIRY